MAIAGCGKSSIVLLTATRPSHHPSISCKPVYRIDIKGPRNGSHLLYYARRATAARILYRYERKTRSAHIGHPARGRLLSITGSLVHKRKRTARTQAMDLWKLHPRSRTHVAACLPAASSLLLRDNLDLESATFEVRRCPRHARARERIVPRACFFRTFD